jgi:hypothetical protein
MESKMKPEKNRCHRSYGTEPVNGLTFAHVLDDHSLGVEWTEEAYTLSLRQSCSAQFALDGVISYRSVVSTRPKGAYPELANLFYPEFDYYVSDASFADDLFGDSSDDDSDEEDTLNSELLLTEEYIGPEKLDALDSVSGSLKPQRRVATIQPIERKD